MPSWLTEYKGNFHFFSANVSENQYNTKSCYPCTKPTSYVVNHDNKNKGPNNKNIGKGKQQLCIITFNSEGRNYSSHNALQNPDSTFSLL